MSQMRDSKSERKSRGQSSLAPLMAVREGSLTTCSKPLEVIRDSRGGFFCGVCGCSGVGCDVGSPGGAMSLSGVEVIRCLTGYSRPRHQMGAVSASLFLGSGSHIICTTRLPKRPKSALIVAQSMMLGQL